MFTEICELIITEANSDDSDYSFDDELKSSTHRWNQSTIISLDWLNTFRIYLRTNSCLVHWSVRRQV